MKKFILIIVAAVALAFSANAQPYANSVGLALMPSFSRGNTYVGVQWNHFLSEQNHFDARFLYNSYWGPSFELMYDWDFPISSVNGLSLYLGPGVHGGYIKDYNGFGDNCVCFGLTAAAGLEYVFSDIPLALSIDWHPFLTWEPKLYGSEPSLGLTGINLGVKYCF